MTSKDRRARFQFAFARQENSEERKDKQEKCSGWGCIDDQHNPSS